MIVISLRLSIARFRTDALSASEFKGLQGYCQAKISAAVTAGGYSSGMTKAPSPFRWFDSSPEVIRLVSDDVRPLSAVAAQRRRRRIDPAFVVDEDIDVAGFETLWPVNERCRLPQRVCGQTGRFRSLRHRG